MRSPPRCDMTMCFAAVLDLLRPAIYKKPPEELSDSLQLDVRPIGFRWHFSVRALFVFAGMPLKRTVFDALCTVDCAAIRTIAERTALFQWGATAVTDKTTC